MAEDKAVGIVLEAYRSDFVRVGQHASDQWHSHSHHAGRISLVRLDRVIDQRKSYPTTQIVMRVKRETGLYLEHVTLDLEGNIIGFSAFRLARGEDP
jgi:hypothetical protein